MTTGHIALSIERRIFVERHLDTRVICPPVVNVQPGGTFICVAKSYTVKQPHRLVSTPFKVTINNTRGYVTYKGE